NSGPNFAYFSTVRLQPDGKILAAGHLVNVYESDDLLAIARYQPNGAPDTTFGAGGMVRTVYRTTDFSGEIEDMALQSDGKIVLAGRSGLNVFGDSEFAVMRLRADGSRDPSFGANGVVISGYSERYVYARGVAVQNDGRIVIVGDIQSVNVVTQNSLLARLNADGSRDTTFGLEPTLGR